MPPSSNDNQVCNFQMPANTDMLSNPRDAENATEDVIEYALPDTKFAWGVALAAFFNLTMVMGTLNSFGVYQKYYLNHLYPQQSAVIISWIATLLSFCMFFGGIFTGKLVNAFGFRLTCLSGSIMCGVSLILASFTHYPWQLIVTQGIMLGLGASLVFSPSMSIVAQWHVRHRVLATGVAVSGGGVGGMILSIASEKMIERIGYRWSLRVLGILLIVISGFASMAYKRRISPVNGRNIAFLLMLMRDARFLCLAAALLFINMGYFEPLLYVPTLAAAQSDTKDTASNIVLAFNAGTTVGRLLSGVISDAIGPSNANCASDMLCCALVCIFLLGTNTIAGLYVFSTLFGMLSTLYLAINAHILAREFGAQAVASSIGLSMACCGLGVLIGNPIQGMLYEQFDRSNQRLVAVSAWTAACFAAAAMCYATLRWIIVKMHNLSHFSKI